jgi:hypothetical protein
MIDVDASLVFNNAQTGLYIGLRANAGDAGDMPGQGNRFHRHQ